MPQVAGFFPVVAARLSKQVGPGLLAIAAAVKTQQRSKDALASLLPVGLGAQGGNYNRVFIDTFTRIVINKEDINKVLEDEGQKLQDVLNTARRAVLEAGSAEHRDVPGRGELAPSDGDGSRAGGSRSAAAATLGGSAVLADPPDARLPRHLLRLADGEVVPARLPGRRGQLVDASIDRMYHDAEFKHALWFTLLLVAVIVPLQFVIAFVMALIVNATLRDGASSSSSSSCRSRSPTSQPDSSGSRSSPTTAT